MGSKPTGQHGSLFLVTIVSCQVDISEIGRLLAKRSPTVCIVRVCVRVPLNMIIHKNFPLNLHSVTRLGQSRKKGKLTVN